MGLAFILYSISALILFCITASYAIAYKLTKSLSVFALLSFFATTFTMHSIGLWRITEGISDGYHWSTALISLVVNSFVLYTTWRIEDEKNKKKRKKVLTDSLKNKVKEIT